MKAEHRKELQTNALADKMGRFFKGVKTGIQTSSLAVWALVILVVVIIGAWWYFSKAAKNARSQSWVDVDQIGREVKVGPVGADKKVRAQLQEFITKHPGTGAALVARLQLARLDLREQGLDLLPQDPTTALANLERARKELEELAGECKGDPYLVPFIRLDLAKITEANAVKDPQNVKKAAAMYEKVAKDYPDSAAGKEAAEHARQLRENASEVEAFYKQLGQDTKTS